MGFLIDAYGKLMAGKLYRTLNFQKLQVQRRLNKVTKEIAQKEKLYDAQKRNMDNQMRNQMQNICIGAANQMGIPIMPGMGMDGMGMLGNNLMGMAAQGTMNILQGGTGLSTQQWSQYSAIQQVAQMQFAQAQNMWDNMYEMQRDADLQALKDLEDELQTEKDSLETRAALAKEEYQAFKDAEKEDVKNLTPNYTGQ